MQKPCEGPVLPVLGYFGHKCNLEKLGSKRAQILQIMVRETQKVIQSVQLITSHEMIPYSNPKAVGRSSFACFRVFGALVPFWEQGPNAANHG